MNYVLFESAGKQKFNAGSKARKDALKIATDCGYEHITLFHNGATRFVVAREIIIGCLSAVVRAGKEDRILIQYPYYPMLLNRILFWILGFGRKMKRYSVSVLIHDVSCLRDTCVENQTKNEKLRTELHMMRGCELIYHNEIMRDVCESLCPAASYQVLGPFDYLYDGEICQRCYSSESIVVIAGNLSKEKCGYIYQLSDIGDVDFDLFGANYTGEDNKNVHYRGKFSPEELICHLSGQFGLIWDGDSIETCSGENGNYLRYNNPHKFSLYIVAGLPLIVWKESALAGYVEEHKIGISISSLHELGGVLRGISPEQYKDMCGKVSAIRAEIIHGEHLRAKLLRS